LFVFFVLQIGITGMAFQELVAGTPVVEQTPFFFGDPIM
jgi:hypothetical protein